MRGAAWGAVGDGVGGGMVAAAAAFGDIMKQVGGHAIKSTDT